MVMQNGSLDLDILCRLDIVGRSRMILSPRNKFAVPHCNFNGFGRPMKPGAEPMVRLRGEIRENLENLQQQKKFVHSSWKDRPQDTT